MEDITIRPAQKCDIPFILECIKGLAKREGRLESVTTTSQDIEELFFNAKHKPYIRIALYGSDLAGMVLYYQTYSTFQASTGLYIEDLFVMSDFRGRGIGAKIMEYLGDIANNEGHSKIEWHVVDTNDKAINFYNKLGAKKLENVSILYLDL